jgi:anti-sigma factor RsiW
MTHVTTDAIERWQRGELPPDEVLAIARHLGSCRECLLHAEPRDLDRRVAALRTQVEDLEHPDLETELFAYVDGVLDPENRERINEHLAACSRCREDVADARAVSWRPPRMAARGWLIALAALLAAVFVGALLLPSRRVVETPQRPSARLIAIDPAPPPRVDEAATARRALVDARLVMPSVLRSFRGDGEVLRSATSEQAQLAPAGVVVESRRPELKWEAPEGAGSVAAIYAGEREIVRSPLLSRGSWTPPALERGVTYTWEIQIHTSGGMQIVPAPPAPPARFHVLDARIAKELDAARSQSANDPLLLGVLYAQAGLETRARAELAKVGGAEREIARQRIREIDSWH